MRRTRSCTMYARNTVYARTAIDCRMLFADVCSSIERDAVYARTAVDCRMLLRMCVQVLNAKFGFHMCEHERHLANSNACRGKKASTMFFAAHTYTFSVFNAEAYSLASRVQIPPFRETIDCYDETFSLVQRQHVLAARLFIFAWQRY